jgi:oligopeptide/dipeptide ABC transporter ATP-binding protein
VAAPLLEVRGLTKRFPLARRLGEVLTRGPRRDVKALNGVDLSVRKGETLGIVGESGCGKSTFARCLVRLLEADEGVISYGGEDVRALEGAGLRQYRRRVQMVFQDPYGSLNPRQTVGAMLAEALRVHRLCDATAIPRAIAELLALVGLPADAAQRSPHEFSGGQRQRIAIARALAVKPDCLVADEVVSALDLSVQAQVVNLLLELQARLELTILFVAHDLRLVRHISHRVAVMYLGRIVEFAETDALFERPRHPYTQALLAAAPTLNPDRRTDKPAVRGELPSPLAIPMGCPFHPRCPHVFDRCRTELPLLLRRPDDGGSAACHLLDRPVPDAA